MPSVLIVDDEPNIAELATLYLEREGFKVHSVLSGKQGIEDYDRLRPDLIILDLMLPDIDGFEVCRQLRFRSAVPILMLTARKEDVDKIVGLELGADDYLTKPFNPRELVARVKAILRRGGRQGEAVKVLSLKGMQIDLARHEVTVGNNLVALRSKEFALLATLAENVGIVFTRERLLELVWGYEYYGETRTVDVHINHLRDKIAGSGVDIETVRGTGYRITIAAVDR
jgi:two-component system, OmpR family, alkaline phosphatase synthesis response regulator PhoP